MVRTRSSTPSGGESDSNQNTEDDQNQDSDRDILAFPETLSETESSETDFFSDESATEDECDLDDDGSDIGFDNNSDNGIGDLSGDRPDLRFDVVDSPKRSLRIVNTQVTDRSLVFHQDGQIVQNRPSIFDIYDGGLHYLSSNHVGPRTLPNGVVTSIPALFNLDRIQHATKSLSSATQDQMLEPRTFSAIQQTLDYVFGLKNLQPGPPLFWAVKSIPNTNQEVVSDWEIARMMLEENYEEKSEARYAWCVNGQIRPEYRDILKENMVQLGATEADKKRASPRGYEYKKLSPGRRQAMIDERYEKGMPRWEIWLSVRSAYCSKFKCRECGGVVMAREQEKHKRDVQHEVPAPGFDKLLDPENTLQINKRHKQKSHLAYRFTLFKADYPEKEVIEEIAKELVNFYRKLPCPFQENMKMPALALVCKRVRDRRKALLTKHPHDPVKVLYQKPYYMIQSEKDAPVGVHARSVHIDIYLYQPGTLLSYKLDPFFQPTMMLRHMTIPNVPEYIHWTTRQRSKVGLEAIVEPIQDDRIHKAVQLAKFISFQMSGKIIAKKAALQIIDYYRSFFQNAAVHFENFERRHTLFKVVVKPELDYSKLLLNDVLKRALKSNLPHVILHSINRLTIASVLDRALNTYLENGDIIETVRVLAESADMINDGIRDGSPTAEFSHNCDNFAKEFTLHHCPECFKVETCKDLTLSEPSQETVRCRRCRNSDSCLSQSLTGKKPQLKQAPTPLSDARHRLRGNLQSESGITRSSSTELKEEFDQRFLDIWEVCKKPFLEGRVWKFHDSYTDAKPLLVDLAWRSPQGRTSPVRKLMNSSFDAAFPYYVYRDIVGMQNYGVHCPPNMWPTTIGHNLGKHTNLPGVLHLASVCWSFSHPGANSILPVEELHDCLLEQANAMQLVQIQTPYSMGQRLELASKMTISDFEEIKNDWIRAVPSRNNDVKTATLSARIFRPPAEWKGKPDNWERDTYPIILQMERNWGARLPRGDDGCPFFGLASAMPKDWNHWMCRTLFTDRVATMWALCNGSWPQVDTADTLYLTACMAHLDPTRQEWLNLPISPLHRHPFRLSIGKTYADQMMHSGWTTPFPSSLEQYDASMANLEIETAFSNFMKGNASHESCQDARNHLLNIELSKELYDPPRLLRPNHRTGPQYQSWSIDKPQKSDNVHRPALYKEPSSEKSEVGSQAPCLQVEIARANAIRLHRPYLFNDDEFCWWNSRIHFLYMIEPLRQAILLLDFEILGLLLSDRDQLTSFRYRLVHALQHLFVAIKAHTMSPTDLGSVIGTSTALWTALRKPNVEAEQQTLSGMELGDACESIVWILDQLSYVSQLAPALSLLDYRCGEYVVKSCLSCPGTSQESTVILSNENILTLNLPPAVIPGRSEYLTALLASAFTPTASRCPEACPNQVKDHGIRQSTLFFDRLPEYLIVHVSRVTSEQKNVHTDVIETSTIDLSSLSGIENKVEMEAIYTLQSEIRHESFEPVSIRSSQHVTDSSTGSVEKKFNNLSSSQGTLEGTIDEHISMLLFKKTRRPHGAQNSAQSIIVEDDGALSALKAYSAEQEQVSTSGSATTDAHGRYRRERKRRRHL